MAKLNTFDDAARMRAYGEQPNDSAAARSLGMKPAAFSNWRTSRSLPSKHPVRAMPHGLQHGNHSDPLRVLRALSAAKQCGKSEAMRKLGIHRNVLLKWEKRFGGDGEARRDLLLAAMRQRRDNRFIDDSADEMAEIRAELAALIAKQEADIAWSEKRAEMRGSSVP